MHLDSCARELFFLRRRNAKQHQRCTIAHGGACPFRRRSLNGVSFMDERPPSLKPKENDIEKNASACLSAR
jgi:hypothetical protein